MTPNGNFVAVTCCEVQQETNSFTASTKDALGLICYLNITNFSAYTTEPNTWYQNRVWSFIIMCWIFIVVDWILLWWWFINGNNSYENILQYPATLIIGRQSLKCIPLRIDKVSACKPNPQVIVLVSVIVCREATSVSQMLASFKDELRHCYNKK